MDFDKTPPVWINKALRFLDIKERDGLANNPVIMSFYKDVGHGGVQDDETPWCAAFVGALLERCGLMSTRSLLARSYLNWGAPLDRARVGAIAIFKRGRDQTKGHVGFVMGQDDKQVYILGGNQSDEVNIQPFKRKDLLGFRWPTGFLDPGEKDQSYSDAFKLALGEVLKLEGGWSDHPKDPGGATNQGITLKTYQKAIEANVIARPNKKLIEALKTISKADLETIYFTLYWEKAGCSHLPKPLAVMQFDASVNHGVRRAIQFLQQSIGADVDGQWGPLTKAKAGSENVQDVLSRYEEIRRRYYLSRPHFNSFGKGWLKRLSHIYQITRSLITSTKPTATTKETRPMTTQENRSEKWWGESLTIWGTIVTALSTILPLVAPLFGFDITSDMVQQFGATVTQLIQIIGGLTGTGMAIYGRARAGSDLTRRTVNVKL